jgi:hypothetical protein
MKYKHLNRMFSVLHIRANCFDFWTVLSDFDDRTAVQVQPARLAVDLC